MRIVFTVGLQSLCIALLCSSAGMAQDRPSVPEQPSSEDECAAFSNAYHSYLTRLSANYYACDRANGDAPVSEWRSGYSCGTHIKVPPACVEASNRWDCATSEYSSLQRQCSARLPRNRNADDPLRRSLLDAVGLPPPEVAGLRMARRLVEAGKNEDAKSLLANYDALSKYKANVQALKTLYDPNVPPERRVTILANFSASKMLNPLAADLTQKAIGAAVAANQQAMTLLLRELNQISGQAAGAERTAIQAKLSARIREIEVLVNARANPQSRPQRAVTADNEGDSNSSGPCQGPCSNISANSEQLNYEERSTAIFKVRNSYPYSVGIRFFSQSRNNRWPGGKKAYRLDDSSFQNATLTCQEGEQICYGAWVNGDSKSYWGTTAQISGRG